MAIEPIDKMDVAAIIQEIQDGAMSLARRAKFVVYRVDDIRKRDIVYHDIVYGLEGAAMACDNLAK